MPDRPSPHDDLSYLRVQYPELAESFMRALGIQGPLVDALETAIQLGINVLDLTTPDLLWLKRVQQFDGGGQAGPVAAQNSILQFVNPAGSGVIATVWVTVVNNGGAAATLQWGDGNGGALGGFGAINSNNRDTRQFLGGALAIPRCSIFSGTQVGTPFLNRMQVQNAQMIQFLQPWIVTPGKYIGFAQSAVNQTLTGSFFWTERQAGPMEGV